MISYWHATIDRDPLPSDELPAEAGVAVVGGGVLGACTALWLARAGLAPLLIERAGPAAGASGHNGGLLVAGAAEGYPATIARLGRDVARAIYTLTLEGFGLMGDLVREEAIDCDLRLPGNVNLAMGEGELAELRQAVALLREDGFPAELLDRQSLQELVGAPLGPEIAGAKLNPTAGALHSGRLVHGLMAAARRHGARLVWGAELRGAHHEGGGLLLQTSRGDVRAGAAVLALNAWSGDVFPALAGQITPVRGQALATGPVPPMLRGGFGASLTPTGEYGQQALDGRVIFGGCRAVAPGRDVGVREPGGSPEVQAALDASLARLFPSLASAPVELRWSGTMAFTRDYLPIIDALPGLPHAWFAGGFSGHGMPYAAIVGRLLAQAASSGDLPAVLAPFGLARPSLA
jgi:glycine/D-amino acid oxidase-like deaminating enzyme